MKTTADKLVTVYALMYAPSPGSHRSLCAIFSTQQKADRFAKMLTKKLTTPEKDDKAAYTVDPWHLDGAR